MKKRVMMPLFAMAAFAAGGLMAQAQDQREESASKVLEKVTLLPKPAAPADKSGKKPAKKKKKRASPESSEYKFSAFEPIPAYTFDKYTNPIIKEKKPKKKPAKKKPAPKKAAVKERPAAPPDQTPPADEGGEEEQQMPPGEQQQMPPSDDQQTPPDQGGGEMGE